MGADSAVLDANDVVDLVTDCEAVDRPAAAPGGGGGAVVARDAAGAALTVGLSKPTPIGLRALARGKALAVTATISQPCAATLKLAVSAAEARRAELGRTAVTLASPVKAAPAGTLRASLKIKKAYRSKLGHLKKLKATLSISCVGRLGRDHGADDADHPDALNRPGPLIARLNITTGLTGGRRERSGRSGS